MPEEKQKIKITDQSKEEQVEIKKGRDKVLESQIADDVKELYKNSFHHLDRPLPKSFSLLAWVVIISVVLGVLAGIGGGLFLLTRDQVTIPLVGQIDLTRFFPEREVKMITEKKVTVSQDLRLASLAEDLAGRVVHIYQAKEVPEQGRLSFLEQIYAPWQRKSLAVILTSDGWLVTSSPLEEAINYAVVDEENNVYPVVKIIADHQAGVNFMQIKIDQTTYAEEQPSVAKFVSPQDISPGQQAVAWDRFNDLHLTSVAQLRRTEINTTEDLMRSTDYYQEQIILDSETSLTRFPHGAVFNLDGALIGLISGNRIIPSWEFQHSLIPISQEEEIVRPYLGIDYFRIERSPGLISPLFRELKQGAIVYGDPAEDSPAYRAGIRNADVIIKVDGLNLNQERDFTQLVQEKTPGDMVELTVLREGEEIIFNVELGSSSALSAE